MSSGDDSLDHELMEAYFDELGEVSAVLSSLDLQNVNIDSLKLIRQNIHKIKGNAAMIGLNEFSEVLKCIEGHAIECIESKSYSQLKTEYIDHIVQICNSMLKEKVTGNESISNEILELKKKINL